MSGSRRDFLRQVGAVGGSRAVFLSLQALGLIDTAAAAEPVALQPNTAHGTKVIILGAGMAGLSAAYELGKAGYDCTVLEARERVGGRNWTIRRGTALDMTDGTHQRCDFDPGLYWNAGPARLPSHHQTVLGYCRELGVALEVEVNTNRGARLYNPAANNGQTIELRQAINDTRGAIAELLGKVVNRGALDQEFTSADKERLLGFLKDYGDLDPSLIYKGSTRAGYTSLPGAAEVDGTMRDPVPLSRMLDIELWSGMLFEEVFDMQATMFQPIGGMDQIPTAFAKKLGNTVRLGCEVIGLRRTPQGVRAVYRDHRAKKTVAIEAPYCIVTIPLKVLVGIDADFAPDTLAAIDAVPYGNAVKIAWQSRRFWEQEDHIYGGISWVKGPTTMAWYPSGGFFGETGILLGAYATRDDADGLAAQALAEQFAASRAMIEGLHPGRGAELKHPMAIAWSKVPWSLGIAARFRADQTQEYALLNEPDGPFYFAGEHLSHIGAWQEGALLSARRAINKIDSHRRVRQA